MFACGFESGCVQLFDMTSSLIEYRSVERLMSQIISSLTLAIIVGLLLDYSLHLQAPYSTLAHVILL